MREYLNVCDGHESCISNSQRYSFFLLLFKFFIKRIRVRILSTSLLQLLNYPKKSSARVYVMAQIINAKSIHSKVAKKNSF